ncbi:MAG: hypothetical protein HC788_05190 [Sphingopyxis sp.]|nr:hypothetical protein [Sphingopyxis sp.]
MAKRLRHEPKKASVVQLIAADEWRLMRRNRVAMLGLAMLLALSVIAALTAIAQRDNSDDIRARFQAQADQAFDGAPARHPHRMVHYGHFVFRPLPPLAAFDPGVDAFTGNTIYLEGHRQNSANFGDVRQSSLLVRFGQLTPAFVLQALAPLMLIFIGFGVVARERERGRQLVALQPKLLVVRRVGPTDVEAALGNAISGVTIVRPCGAKLCVASAVSCVTALRWALRLWFCC